MSSGSGFIRVERAAFGCLLATIAIAIGLAASAPQARAQAGDPAALLGNGIAQITDRVTCPLITPIAGPLGEVGQTLKTAICALRSLGYTIRTVYRRPDGSELVRETGALLILPTLVNADDDLLPDLTVSLSPLGTDRFEVRIDRGLLETAQLPVRVEVIARDPTNGSIPRDNIAFGYDARHTRAPNSFRTQIRVGESATEASATTVGIGTSVSGAGPQLAVVGGIFDGTPAQRVNPIGGRLNYTGVPATSGAELVLGRRLGVRFTSSSPTRLEADAEMIDGADSTTGHVVIDKLPAAVEGIYDPDADPAKAGKQLAVNYTATALVDTLNADLRSVAGGEESQVVLRARGLPTGVAAKLTGPGAGSVEATGGPIGSAEIGFANGAPRLLATDNQYVNIIGDGDLSSTAAKVHQLKRAKFSAGEPEADKDFTVAAGSDELAVPGHGYANGDKVVLTALTDGTPLEGGGVYHVVGASANSFKLAEDDGGQPIDVTAAGSGKVARLDGRLQFDGEFAPPNPKPLEIRVNDAERDVSGNVASLPDHVKLDADFPRGRVEFDGFGQATGRFTFDARQTKPFFGSATRIVGDLTSIPAKSLLTFSSGSGPSKVDFTGSSAIENAEIGFADGPPRLLDTDDQYVHQFKDATLDSFAAQVARLKRASVTIAKEEVAKDFTLSTADALSVDGHGHQNGDKVTLTALSGGAPLEQDGVYYVVERTDNSFKLAKSEGGGAVDVTANGSGKVLKLNKPVEFEGEFTPPNPKPLVVKVDKPDQKVDGKVEQLPAHLKFFADFPGGKVDFDGFGQGTGKLTFDARQTTPFFERATRLYGNVTKIPALTSLRFGGGDSGATFTASEAIERAEITASDGTSEVPAGTGAGAVYRDVKPLTGRPGKFVVAARVFDLKSASFSGGAAKRIKVDARSGPFNLLFEGSRGDKPETVDTVEATVRDLPGVIDLLLDVPGGKTTLDGSADIGSIDFDARTNGTFVDRANRISGTVKQIPRKVEITAKPEDGGFRFASKEPPVPGAPGPQADKPLGEVDLMATSGGSQERVAAGKTGVLVRDIPAGVPTEAIFHAALRLKKLSGAYIRGKPLAAEVKTGEAQPFELDYRFDEAGDAITTPAQVNGTIDQLPTELRIDRGSQIDYRANATIPKLHVDAHNLPGAKLDGDPHELVLDVTDVPKIFTLHEGRSGSLSRIGVEQNLDPGRFGTIAIDAWDHGPRPAAPPDGRNTVKLDKTGGRLTAQVRLFDLVEGVATTIGDSIGVDAAFSVDDPKPVDATIKNPPTTFIGTVPTPPKTLELDISSGVDSRVKYVANRAIPSLDATLYTKSAGAELFLDNLPPKLEFCVDSSGFACDADAPMTVIANEDDDETYTVLNDFNMFVDVEDQTGDLVFNGWACFDPEDGPTYSKFFVPSECFDEGADFGQTGNRDPDMRKFLRIDNLRLNGDFDFEFGQGDTLQGDSEDGPPGSCGFDPEEDGIVKLWFDTNGAGLLANSILYMEKGFDECDDFDEDDTDVQILKGGLPRLTAKHYWIWIDADLPPDTVAETTEPGSFLQCDNTSIIVDGFDAEPFLPICD